MNSENKIGCREIRIWKGKNLYNAKKKSKQKKFKKDKKEILPRNQNQEIGAREIKHRNLINPFKKSFENPHKKLKRTNQMKKSKGSQFQEIKKVEIFF